MTAGMSTSRMIMLGTLLLLSTAVLVLVPMVHFKLAALCKDNKSDGCKIKTLDIVMVTTLALAVLGVGVGGFKIYSSMHPKSEIQ
ncbi:MAG: hypothetical protein EB068_00305 [Betaproteobacteria bacterium]|nr:hypothetical protein [Betaproteobacteria bacterium]